MRRALVLSGGGAWGSWQVGACQHLVFERGLFFDVISGVSVGAINGAALAHGHDADGLRTHLRRLRDWWFGVRGNEDVYRRRRLSELGHALGGWNGLFDVSPLRDEVLAREIDPAQVASSPVKLRVGYVDLRSRRYRVATNHHPRLREALLASASVPLLFPLTRLANGEVEDVGADGGLHHAAPVEDAVAVLEELPPEPEPAEIWVLLLSPRQPGNPVGILQRLMRMAAPALRMQVERDSRDSRSDGRGTHDQLRVSGVLGSRPMDARLHVLRPEGPLAGAILDFDPKRIRTNHERGLIAARRASELALAS